MASRKQKHQKYLARYSDIPLDYEERLAWMYDKYKISASDQQAILEARDQMLNQLSYKTIHIVLYEEPEGAKRPRTRIINRGNVLQAARTSDFVHIYSPGAAENNNYMRRLVDEQEIIQLEQLICTPCDVRFCAYFKTPSYYNKTETFLAELGLERPITKPDHDNIAKLYSDMYNSTVWIDDALTIHGETFKYYSILPRVEITLMYLNMLYNKHQYNQVVNRKDFTEDMTVDYFQGGINNNGRT